MKVNVGQIREFCKDLDLSTKVYVSCMTKEYSKDCDISRLENVSGIYDYGIIDYTIDYRLDKDKTITLGLFLNEMENFDNDHVLEIDIEDGYIFDGVEFIILNTNGVIVLG